MGAIARIEEIRFPTALKPGELITGEIVLMNVGDETTGAEAGYLGVLITTLWDGKEYPLIMYSATKPGETALFSFHSKYPVGVMPDGDAGLEVVGRIWLGWDRGWRVDDVKSWMITPEGARPPICKITEIRAPESAVTGEIILLGALSHNEGDPGMTYIRFVDRDTGEMIPVMRIIDHKTCTNPGGSRGGIEMPARSWNLRCEVGEGDPMNPTSITDSRDLTILNPEYPPPEYYLTLASDKADYFVGESIILSGVLSFGGSPVPGVRVTLYRNGASHMETTTLGDGSYVFEDPATVRGLVGYCTKHVIMGLIFRSPSIRVRGA